MSDVAVYRHTHHDVGFAKPRNTELNFAQKCGRIHTDTSAILLRRYRHLSQQPTSSKRQERSFTECRKQDIQSENCASLIAILSRTDLDPLMRLSWQNGCHQITAMWTKAARQCRSGICLVKSLESLSLRTGTGCHRNPVRVAWEGVPAADRPPSARPR